MIQMHQLGQNIFPDPCHSIFTVLYSVKSLKTESCFKSKYCIALTEGIPYRQSCAKKVAAPFKKKKKIQKTVTAATCTELIKMANISVQNLNILYSILLYFKHSIIDRYHFHRIYYTFVQINKPMSRFVTLDCCRLMSQGKAYHLNNSIIE